MLLHILAYGKNEPIGKLHLDWEEQSLNCEYLMEGHWLRFPECVTLTTRHVIYEKSGSCAMEF